MVSAWREIRDVASPQTRFTPFALPSQEQAKHPSPFGSLPTPTVPKPISQSRSPLAAACVLWPLIEHCCALFSRVSLIGRALCLSEALVSFRRQRPLRGVSRAAWFGPCVCARFSERYPICVSRYGCCSKTSLVEGRAECVMSSSLFLLFVLTAPRPRRRRICRARPGST